MIKIKRKINSFLHSSDKINIIKYKLTSGYQKVVYSFLYNEYGINSVIIKPIRVIGKKYISIGKNVNILNGARMEAIDKWKNKNYTPKIKIGDNVSIGQNFHIISASDLEIGDNVTISGNVFITNIDHVYEDINENVLNQDIEVKNTQIAEGCFIGYGASIQAGTILGKHCVVGTNAVVRGKFDDYTVIVGVPARVVKKYNKTSNKWEKF